MCMRKNQAQYIELTCAATGERFVKYKKEYDRQIKNGATRFFKDRATANAFLSSESIILKRCPVCDREFESSQAKKAPKCCSRSCAAKQTHLTIQRDPELRELSRLKKSAAQKHHLGLVRSGERPRQAWSNGKTPRPMTRFCETCSQGFFDFMRNSVKTCSRECRSVLSSKKSSSNPNCGGETNYRRYRYKDILMDSQWEVDIAMWLDERQVEWRRDRKMVFRWNDVDGKSRRYHPDFYLPAYDVYLDPKNKYLIEKDRFKIETVMKTHGIQIIWGLKDDVIAALSTLVNT